MATTQKLLRRIASLPVLQQRAAANATVFVVGALIAFGAFYWQRASLNSDAQRAFEAWSEERRDLLQRSLDAHLEVLHGVRALFDSSEFVSPEEFRRYAASSLERYPHLRSLDWLPRVPHEQREAFEAHASSALARPYAVIAAPASNVPSGLAGAHWPVLYSQSRDPSLRLGVDELKDSQAAAAMAYSARTDRAGAAIVAHTQPNTGRLYVYLPVYASANGPEHTTLGFVRATFIIDDILRGLLADATQAGVAIDLVDAANADLLAALAPSALQPRTGALGWSGHIQLGNRALTLQFNATSLYAGYPRLGAAWTLLVLGLLVSALGAFASDLLARRRLRLRRLTRELLAEVAERRASEQRLTQSEARYRVLVENSPDAIMLNQDDRIRFVNNACIRLLGAHSADELVGRSVYDFVHPDDQAEVRARLGEMRRSLSVLPAVERRLRRIDGSIVEVESLVVPYQTEEGVMLHVTSRDITKRRQVEAERAGLEAALRQSQKLEALGTLAGGIAHDFNNILSAIVGNTRLLREDLPESHPSAHHVEEIRNATHRARDLVKRLMAFSREQDSQRTAVSLTPLLVEVQQLLRAMLPAGVELIARVDPHTPPVFADAVQVHQVLLNLCTNAWQAMRSHTGRIEITVSTLSATEATARSGAALQSTAQYVCIAVHDNGCGMTPETLEHIFEPFFTTKQPGEGSGLGLAVVHGIVQSHHGAISVVSEPGVGTSFFVYLPASDAPTAAGERTLATPIRGAEQHVLYIDDEEPLVYLAQRMLERAGYRCTGCTEAARALELVRKDADDFDLVITDLNMPGMSGLDVAREVRSIRADLPVVITTGYVRAADIAAARELGVRDVMLKPDTIDELAQSVQKYLPVNA